VFLLIFTYSESGRILAQKKTEVQAHVKQMTPKLERNFIARAAVFIPSAHDAITVIG
jgi:hypothetical protein